MEQTLTSTISNFIYAAINDIRSKAEVDLYPNEIFKADLNSAKELQTVFTVAVDVRIAVASLVTDGLFEVRDLGRPSSNETLDELCKGENSAFRTMKLIADGVLIGEDLARIKKMSNTELSARCYSNIKNFRDDAPAIIEGMIVDYIAAFAQFCAGHVWYNRSKINIGLFVAFLHCRGVSADQINRIISSIPETKGKIKLITPQAKKKPSTRKSAGKRKAPKKKDAKHSDEEPQEEPQEEAAEEEAAEEDEEKVQEVAEEDKTAADETIEDAETAEDEAHADGTAEGEDEEAPEETPAAEDEEVPEEDANALVSEEDENRED